MKRLTFENTRPGLIVQKLTNRNHRTCIQGNWIEFSPGSFRLPVGDVDRLYTYYLNRLDVDCGLWVIVGQTSEGN